MFENFGKGGRVHVCVLSNLQVWKRGRLVTEGTTTQGQGSHEVVALTSVSHCDQISPFSGSLWVAKLKRAVSPGSQAALLEVSRI